MLELQFHKWLSHGSGQTAGFMVDFWLEVSMQKVLRLATSTQVFLGFLVSISKCCDGSQDSKLPLHASHVALPT